MKSPFKAIRIKGKGEKAKYMFGSQDITEMVKQAQKDIEETRPQIKFEWNNRYESFDSMFFKVMGYDFGITVAKSPISHCFRYIIFRGGENEILHFEEILANNISEAKKTVESQQWKILATIDLYLQRKNPPPPELVEYVANFIRKNQSKTKKGK